MEKLKDNLEKPPKTNQCNKIEFFQVDEELKFRTMGKKRKLMIKMMKNMLSNSRNEEESTEENREDWMTRDMLQLWSILLIDDWESAMDMLTLLVYLVAFMLWWTNEDTRENEAIFPVLLPLTIFAESFYSL